MVLLVRSFIYAFLTRGRPVPLIIIFYGAIFCSLNGFLQGHHLLHCAQFEETWLTDARVAAGESSLRPPLNLETPNDLNAPMHTHSANPPVAVAMETTLKGMIGCVSSIFTLTGCLIRSVNQTAGFLLFVTGLTINIHSDQILRSLRKPGEIVYKIPDGTILNTTP